MIPAAGIFNYSRNSEVFRSIFVLNWSMASKNGCCRRNRKNFNENSARGGSKRCYLVLTNPEVAILMMGVFLFAVLLGFPIAFTLMAMGIGFGYYAYYDPALMDHLI